LGKRKNMKKEDAISPLKKIAQKCEKYKTIQN